MLQTVLYVNLSSYFGSKDIFYYLSLFLRLFSVTIATVEVQSILKKNTWIMHLIRQSNANKGKVLFIFGFLGGGGDGGDKNVLNVRPSLYY